MEIVFNGVVIPITKPYSIMVLVSASILTSLRSVYS